MAPITPYSGTNGTSHTTNGTTPSINGNKPIILYLGDPILYNRDLYSHLQSKFTIIPTDISDRHRDQFIQHLKDQKWGNFSAIMRPFWNTGNEMHRWDRELIQLLPPSMKVMASAGAGFDWVDTEALGEQGILYTNGAGASTESVADMALYLIIDVFRRMTWSSQAARSGIVSDFQKAHQKVMFKSHNPRGHALGIVGLGNIGFAIAKKVRAACGMQILYYDISRKPSIQEQEVDATFYSSLEELLGHSDCVLLASPGGSTILNAQTIPHLKHGARVVNIARGSLIDEDALADALDSGRVSAAGLDVHSNEPNTNPRLRDRWNVASSCHTGGSSEETIIGFERLVIQNVEAVLEGREPLTAVNKQHLRVNERDGGTNGHTYDDLEH